MRTQAASAISTFHRRGETVSILVGPNGSGKSTLLRNLATQYGRDCDTVIICNTPHDRFANLRNVRRLTAGRRNSSPKAIIKKAVADSLSDQSSEFFQISSTLEYCGYSARFGFRVTPGPLYGMPYAAILSYLQEPGSVLPSALQDPDIADPNEVQGTHTALSFLHRHAPSDPVWIDSTQRSLEFSLAREFSAVLRLESKLRSWNVLRGIDVYLERDADKEVIEVSHASSGQLALISSLLFLITNTGHSPLILIDEPENSLHPKWQREYIDKILTALTYRSAKVFVATHSPLIVTGAITENQDLVSVFKVFNGRAEPIPTEGEMAHTQSIEEILWEAFEVVTPANHFVSERIVDEITRFENGETTKEKVIELIEEMEGESFDNQQISFFSAVKKLVDEVDGAATRNTLHD